MNNEIKMKDDTFSVSSKDKTSASLNPKNRINVFLKEGAAIVATTTDLIKPRTKPVVRPPKNWVDKKPKRDKDNKKSAASGSAADGSASSSAASSASSAAVAASADLNATSSASGSAPPPPPENAASASASSASSAASAPSKTAESSATSSSSASSASASAPAPLSTAAAPAPAPAPAAVPAAVAAPAAAAVADSSNTFYTATPDDIDAVQEMFDIVWMGALATFGTLLECYDEPRLVALCLDGYRHAVRVSAAFALDTQRTAFVGSIAKFTLLGTTKEMKQKNVDAINTLISIAHTEGNYLKSKCARLSLSGWLAFAVLVFALCADECVDVMCGCVVLRCVVPPRSQAHGTTC